MPNFVPDQDEPRCRCGHVSFFHWAILEGSKQKLGDGACCKMDCSCMQWTDVPKPKVKKKTQVPTPVPA